MNIIINNVKLFNIISSYLYLVNIYSNINIIFNSIQMCYSVFICYNLKLLFLQARVFDALYLLTVCVCTVRVWSLFMCTLHLCCGV